MQTSMSREEVMLRRVEQAKAKTKKKKRQQKKKVGGATEVLSEDSSAVHADSVGADGVGACAGVADDTHLARGRGGSNDPNPNTNSSSTNASTDAMDGSGAEDSEKLSPAEALLPEEVLEEAKAIRDQTILRAARRSAKKEVEELQRSVLAQKAMAMAKKAAVTAAQAAAAAATRSFDKMKQDDAQRLADAWCSSRSSSMSPLATESHAAAVGLADA
jgi:hypothetical protein